MKKVLFFAAVAALALNATVWCSSITVTSPAGGVSWCLGSANTITWTKSGDMQDTVAIRLRIAGSADAVLPVVEITNGAPNNGSFPWTVPGTVPAGDYFIRVKTVDGMVVGDSATFKIVSSPAIIVTDPNGTTWDTGSAHTIHWNKVCDMQNTVAIRLRTAGSADAVPPVVEITNSTANDGSFSWTVPASVAYGSYFIRVKTVDGTVVGDSVNFNIGHFTFPHDWWKRKYYEVKWPKGPDPCLCPEWNIRDLLERIREINPKFVGSLSLLKNGAKIQELGRLGGRSILGDTLKPSLSRANFNAFKNGSAKFSMGLFDAQGNLLQEIQLQGEQQLR